MEQLDIVAKWLDGQAAEIMDTTYFFPFGRSVMRKIVLTALKQSTEWPIGRPPSDLGPFEPGSNRT